MCQALGHFSGFLYHFLLAKLASSSIRVKVELTLYSGYHIVYWSMFELTLL